MYTNHIPKLTKAPLQEVIFEAFWELDIHPQSRESDDPGFELAQGVFAEIVRQEFPFYKRVAPPLVPVHFLLHRPVHQFWRGHAQWPVLQLGPGLLSANDTEETYVWESGFRPVIEYALDTVLKSYIKEAPRFNKVSLRYIDAVELEGEFQINFVKFIETNLQIRVARDFEIGSTE
ncbi:MAG: TIGR04255 family protein [Candidatus Tectomicrobia bacterium]|nr:TIGR04255 family protein [Candidatus Tectomicrobia bacterium]